jgi:hypothetical protein
MGAEIVVVLGLTSYTPYAGVAWQTAHYLEGLSRLGYRVYYLEDHGYWPYDPYLEQHTDDCRGTVRYISELMARLGMEDRWAYRDVASDWRVFGMSEQRLNELLGAADVLVNLTGSTVLRDVHMEVPVRMYLETDPVLAQIELAKGDAVTLERMRAHTHHATYGENFGAPDCGVPATGFEYIPTRPPVILDWWTPREPDPSAPYTTIGSWEQSFKDVEWEGERYTWSKHEQFLKVLELPASVSRRLELSLATRDRATIAMLEDHGWSVRDAAKTSRDLDDYRDYVRGSWGEFTVAKDQNVRLRSGWFSDRSACYLAAGRPVVTQETGFSNVLPTGEGLFGFRELTDIVAAFDEIESRPEHHRSRARRIAEERFRAEDVLAALMASVAESTAASGSAM